MTQGLTSTTGTQGSWQTTVERTVVGLGYDLVDTERSAGGLLRVYIDRVPGHAYDTGESAFVTVDDCEVVTRQLQFALEVAAVDYARLEVSSPGLDRPIKRASDWPRFAGEQVEVTLRVAFQNRKKWQGRLEARDDVPGGWRLVFTEGVGKKAVEHAFDFTLEEVREARLVPVLDFKGRKNKADNKAAAAPGDAGVVGDDGGSKR